MDPAKRLVCFWLVALGLLWGSAPAGYAQAQVTGADINRAIERGVGWLKGRQLADGAWRYAAQQQDGATALCVYALLVAGVPPDDPAVQAGIAYFIDRPPQHTYTVTLNILALTRADPRRHRTRIAECADYLVEAQQRGERNRGMWTYGKQQGRSGDNSNTQFAMLGLYEAQRAGVAIPRAVWMAASTHYTKSQHQSGGWGYRPGARPSGSMTAAAIASLHMVGNALYGPTKTCGQSTYDKRVAAGIQWLAQNFSVERNPGGGHHYYYLYALERAGMITGLKYFGSHDWYREGASHLVRRQGANGSWGNEVDTAFALLFLAKGKVPVLINKVQWEGTWNDYPHDVEHLSQFVGEQFEQTLGWQVVTLREGRRGLRQAPILFLNGHGPINFSAEEKQVLRDYVDQGGFVFVVSNCTQRPFRETFKQLVSELFPGRELEPLPPNHPVWRSHFRISAQTPLMGITVGCRTPLIYSQYDLSKHWERMDSDAATRQALQIATNICAYATGRQPLPDKLDQEQAAAQVEPELPTQRDLRGAFTFAQVTYTGDWDTGPLVGNRVSAQLRRELGMATASTRKEVALSDPDLFEYPFLFMSGREQFSLTAEEKARLKEYLDRGGFLFVEAACGSPEFDRALRPLVQELFPQEPMGRLALDHPIFHAYYDINEVQYSPAVEEQQPGFNEPFLEGVTINGRTVLVYSRYSLGFGIERAPFLGSRGLTYDSAIKLFTNIIVYAMSY